MRSIISVMVEPSQIRTIYSPLSIMYTVGTLLAVLIMAQNMSWTVRLDGLGKGMSYMVPCALCDIQTLLLPKLRVSGPKEEQQRVGSLQDGDME